MEHVSAVRFHTSTGALPDHVWKAAAERPRGTKFAQIPEWLLQAGITGLGIKVFGAIARRCGYRSRTGYPSRRDIASFLGVSLSSVDRGLRELRRLGALISDPRWRTNGGQSSNRYAVLWVPLSELLEKVRGAVSSDEGSSSELTTGQAPAARPEPAPAATSQPAPTSADTPRGVVSSGEGVGPVTERDQEEGGTRRAAPVAGSAAAGPDSPPPSTCPKHPHGTPEPCGACMWHRKNRERWDGEQLLARIAAVQEQERQRAAERQAEAQQRQADAIAACSQCDWAGERPDGSECDHRSRAARQAATAAFSAALAARPRRYSGKRSWRDRRRPSDLQLPLPAPIPGVSG